MLEGTRAGQWSVDDFDWSQPLQGAGAMSARERREAGLSLLFTAGLERQAARVFEVAGQFVDDDRARQIYLLFRDDELRHAEAEVRLARRYGTEWDDLPVAAKWMFRTLAKNFEDGDLRGAHELSSATIVLFELALDSLLIPALKQKSSDQLQAEVFRRIDIDESRHLAMDYWLLDRKGKAYGGRGLDELFRLEHGRDRTLRERLVGRYKLYRTAVAFMVGFGAVNLSMPGMRLATMKGDSMSRYLRRVAAIPKKAPHAHDVPAFVMGLNGQQKIMGLLWRMSGKKLDVAEYLEQ